MNFAPPRFLTGITLLYWGGITGHLFIAIIVATVVELKSWVSIRWDLNDDSYVKAWHLSVLLATSTAVLSWLNGTKPSEIHQLFVWTPLFFLPIELAQVYGKKDQITLNTFFYFARKKHKRDLLLKRQSDPYYINIGYIYISIICLATAVGSLYNTAHLIGLPIIISLCLYSRLPKVNFRPVAFSFALVLAVIFSGATQWGIKSLRDKYTNSFIEGLGNFNSSNESRTRIGSVGEIKLNPQVLWRLKTITGEAPNLLTVSIYNSYFNSVWRHRYEEKGDNDYLTALILPDADPEKTIFTFDPDRTALTQKQNSFQITGSLDADSIENPIPIANNTIAIGVDDIGASVETNSIGTVRMLNTILNLVDYPLWYGETSHTEAQPDLTWDLNIPEFEIDGLRNFNEQVGLHNEDLSTKEKIELLKFYFIKNFTYTTHLETAERKPGSTSTDIQYFLETSRAGHCEYYGTSAVLLLRELGIPARYCFGFVVDEYSKSRGQWLIRGTSAHAWCRVWVDDHWENLDLTPPSSRNVNLSDTPAWIVKIKDTWQLASEDFLLWRTKKSNQSKVTTWVSVIAGLLSIWVIWRLIKTRQINSKANIHYQRPEHVKPTSLNNLEPLIIKKIGSRDRGTPYSEWLLQLIEHEQEIAATLHEAIGLHSQIRFDPDYEENGATKKLATLCDDMKKVITKLEKHKASKEPL